MHDDDDDELLFGVAAPPAVHALARTAAPRRPPLVPIIIAILTAVGAWLWSVPHSVSLGVVAAGLVWLDRRGGRASRRDDLPTRASRVVVEPALPRADAHPEPPPYDPKVMEAEQAHAKYTQEQIARRVQLQRTMDDSVLGGAVITKNAEFKRRLQRAERIARTTDLAILVRGETGTGKGVIVPALFEAKRQAGLVTGALVPANCAVFREQHGLSDLFGHVKGAYTGADSARAGLMMDAHQGILFLDELGEFERSQQAMILIAVERKRFMPMGASQEVSSDFGVMSATNRDLEAMIEAGEFREELYARLGQFELHLMPLRERPEDVEHNVHIELELEGQRRKTRVAMVPAALARFIDFATSPEATWPDNFRGLAAAVKKIVAYAEDPGAIDVDAVEEVIGELRKKWRGRGDGLDDVVPPETLAKLTPLPRYTLARAVEISNIQRTVTKSGIALFALNGVANGTEASRLVRYLGRLGLTFDDILKRRR